MWPLGIFRRTVAPSLARRLILEGKPRHGLRVEGTLDLRRAPQLRRLPIGLKAKQILADDCTHLELLPPDIAADRISAQGCVRLRAIGSGIRCRELRLRRTAIDLLPCDLQATATIDLQQCENLKSLPEGLRVDTLVLRGCRSLERLPERLHARTLDVSDCPLLSEIPEGAAAGLQRLMARDCRRLAQLPPNLRLTHLDLSGCERLAAIPDGVRVTSALDLAGTAITSLPTSLSAVWLYWRGVPIDRRIAFSPETITAHEILRERNVAMRRVLLERMGLPRFIAETHGEEIDADYDVGGARRLLRIPFDGEGPLVCVVVRCPSTGQQYVLRVPPFIETCRQAIAWTAGFDDAKRYRPLVET